jgi:hypothetical protein
MENKSVSCLGEMLKMVFRLNSINLIYGEFMGVSWRYSKFLSRPRDPHVSVRPALVMGQPSSSGGEA